MRHNTCSIVKALSASALGLAALLLSHVRADAAWLTDIAYFHNTNGAIPTSNITFDAAGDAFGTTSSGGPDNEGVVWEIPASTFKAGAPYLYIIATFTGSNGADPYAGVTIDSVGNLYGTTTEGGAYNAGVVWEIPASTLKAGKPWLSVIATFTGSNGQYPYGGVTIDGAGNLYGTTLRGGSADLGVVWEIPASTIKSEKPWLSVIAHFTGSNGSEPEAGVSVDAAGDLFGTASAGGSDDYGVVWEIPASTLKAGKPWLNVIATFIGSNGEYPYANVTVDGAGNLFGTADGGGTAAAGVVWEIPASTLKAGKPWLSVVASFNGSDGEQPDSPVTIDSAGNLLGTGFTGGADKYGVVWEIPASSIKAGAPYITDLAHFIIGNGAYPLGNVAIDASGNLFGTASQGGADNLGVIWEIAE